jgi:hypothetical protein
MSDEPTQFDYLLNAFEQASQSDDPARNGYAEKRHALFSYVRRLERIAAARSVDMLAPPRNK